MNKKSIVTILMCLLLTVSNVFAQEAEDESPAPNSGYISLGDTMVLNLSSEKKRLSFLQLQANVLIKDESAKDIIETHIPAIRHQLILTLSEQNADDLKSPVKREQIRQQVTAEVKQLMETLADNHDVEEVLFSNFLIQ
jgi:flagellar FliL protein